MAELLGIAYDVDGADEIALELEGDGAVEFSVRAHESAESAVDADETKGESNTGTIVALTG